MEFLLLFSSHFGAISQMYIKLISIRDLDTRYTNRYSKIDRNKNSMIHNQFYEFSAFNHNIQFDEHPYSTA